MERLLIACLQRGSLCLLHVVVCAYFTWGSVRLVGTAGMPDEVGLVSALLGAA
jgi:hypothetical protein